MADRCKIEWVVALAEARGAVPSSWNPILGCSSASEGCRNCYAAAIAHRFGRKGRGPFAGLTDTDDAGVPRYNGTIRVQEHLMDLPLRWRKPHVVFLGDMADLFHPAVPDAVLDRIFATVALSPKHLFLVLTKRPERMLRYFNVDCRVLLDRWFHAAPSLICRSYAYAAIHPDADEKHRALYHCSKIYGPLSNLWLGVSTENQPAAEERIPHLLATPAAKRFILAEPLLGAIYLTSLYDAGRYRNALTGELYVPGCGSESSRTITGGVSLDLVIVSGESGPGARPIYPDWVRGLRDQCTQAGTDFFFMRWGEWHPDALLFTEAKPDGQCPPPSMKVGKRAAGRMLDGVEHNEVPE